MQKNFIRYSEIKDKNPREFLLLRGLGCKWKRCRFCDYYLDSCSDGESNFILNKKYLNEVSGKYGILEIVNSGSFAELDLKTFEYIKYICREKKIKTLILESHYMYVNKILELKREFNCLGINLKIKLGIETFDYEFRESYLNKGIHDKSPEELSKYFDQVCLLQGLPGQTTESMIKDINIGLKNFDRVCINIMKKNTSKIIPSKEVIKEFKSKVYPNFIKNKKIDILLDNTDFGVGSF